MFYKAPSPKVRLIRAAVVMLALTTLFAGGLSPFTGINRRVKAALVAAPSNDDFLNAQPMLGVSGVVFGTTVGATKEPLEQNIVGINGTGSVWYKWQAPFSGRFVFMTSGDSGSEFNTLLGVYSGANLPGIQVSANDDDALRCLTISSLGPTLSRVSFDAVGGLVYHIAVDTKGTGGGNFKLRWGRSATITVQPRSVSNGGTFGAAGGAKLAGDMCTSLPSIFTFNDIPTGGSYTVSIIPSDPLAGYGFAPSNQNGSTSPLTGDVTLTYYLMSPTKSLSGRITNLPGPDITGLTVTCVSTNGALFTQPAKLAVIGSFVTFVCGSLPINAEYRVTPSKLGFAFAPADATKTLFGDLDIADPFVATPASHTISGRVTHSNGTTGVSGVTVALSGSQTASRATDANGNYSFTGVLHGGNYTVTPSNANFTFTPLSSNFNNLTADQTANFTAAFLLQLILEESGQVAALDSVLQTRDPFPIVNNSNLLNSGVDRNTRVVVFVSAFALAPGELPSAVTINLVGSNNQTYDIPAEDVRPTSDPTFTQIIFRLPDSLAPGICTLAVKVHGLTSNIGSMRINP
jgi:hypothetical protein